MKTQSLVFALVAGVCSGCGSNGDPASVLASTSAEASSLPLAWSSPAAGSTIGDTTQLALTGAGLVNVEIFHDGAFVTRCTVSADGSSASCQLDTTAFANGPLTLTAHAWNSPAGTPYTADADAGARDFTVSNVPPGTVTLAWQSPAAGSSINGTATLTLSGHSLVNVELFDNGAFFQRYTVASDERSASCAVDTTALPTGPLTLTAHGWNSPAGTPYTSDADAGPLSLVVSRLPAGTVGLAWATPAANTNVSGTTTLTLAGQGLVNVEVFDNGAMVTRCTVATGGASASCALDTTAFPNGPLTLTAHGWDSPAGSAFTHDADAGQLTLDVSNSGTTLPVSDATGVQAFRIADFMERFGINTFSSIPASGSTPAYNPWGSQGDYSAQGVIDCINYLTAGSGLTMLVREYHYGDANDARTTNQVTWCPEVYQATGAQFTVCPGSGGGSSADIAGMTALAQSAASSHLPWLRWLEGDNEPNGNGVSPAAAIAAQSSINSTAHSFGLLGMQMAAIAGLPFAEGYFDGYANGNADTNNVHLYPTIPPDLDDGSNRKGEIGDMLQGSNIVFGSKPTVISEWHPTLYAAAHNLDPSYDQYLAPIFILSAFVNFDARGYIWFALHDYNADMPSGLFTSSVSNPKLPAKTIRAMYALTGDHGASKHTFQPGKLDVHVSGLPAPMNAASPYTGGHFAVFENSAGQFFIYVWNEQAAPGGTATPVTVSFAGLHPRTVVDYDITEPAGNTTAVQTRTNVTTITVNLAAAVHLLLVTP